MIRGRKRGEMVVAGGGGANEQRRRNRANGLGIAAGNFGSRLSNLRIHWPLIASEVKDPAVK